MDAIILFSHGSVLCGAERNLLARAQQMRAAGDAPIVEAAFLNYTEPSVATAIAAAVAKGATRMLIAPYFLVSGKFVTQDLPAVIAEETRRHPGVTFLVGDVIGFHESLADAVLASADRARSIDDWRHRFADAAAFCREQPKCPLYGSSVCRVQAPHTMVKG